MQYLPITEKEQKDMLGSIHVSSMESLFNVIPDEFRLKSLLQLPHAHAEMELIKHMESIAKMNTSDTQATSFIGEINYRHYIPTIVRTLSSLPQFYTAYTPYQPELSQGTLQSIYEFQSFMTNLTDMDLTNASMYDAATSAAEAMLMLCHHYKKNHVLISDLIHPAVRSVLSTYAYMNQIQLITVTSDEGSISYAEIERLANEDCALLMMQTPNVFGIIEDMESLVSLTKEKKIAVCAIVLEAMSLGLLKPPGSFGVEVTVGEAQSFGIPPSFGGPGLGFFSTRKEFIRKIPGRIVGKTVDNQDRTAYVMTLRAREQDIRREKATSNICTNHALCALYATIYLTALGEEGLRKMAEWNVWMSHYAQETLQSVPGLHIPYRKPFFNEFLVELNQPIELVRPVLSQHQLMVSSTPLQKDYPYLTNPLLISVTELNSRSDVQQLADALKEALK